MTREILFRGKRIDNNEWVYGVAGYHKYREKWYICDEELENYEVIPETIGQYTGLKDKNGNKIFEGDIIKTHYIDNEEITVKFDEDRGGYYPFASGDGCGCCEMYVVPPYASEVVGNIYDKED